MADEQIKTLYQAETPWNEYEIIPLNTGIERMEIGENTPCFTGCYDLNGRRSSGKQGGPVILRYNDGSTRKVMVK